MTLRQLVGVALTIIGLAAVVNGVRSTMRRMVNLNIVAKPQKWFPVELVGVPYEAKAPKKALALMLMMKVRNAENDPTQMVEIIDQLVNRMFGAEVAPAVKARLEDEDDDLDIDHLMKLMEALISAVAEDPTTSS